MGWFEREIERRFRGRGRWMVRERESLWFGWWEGVSSKVLFLMIFLNISFYSP